MPFSLQYQQLKIEADKLTQISHRTLVYVEGDARMNTWEDSEGNNRSTLNVVQRTSTAHSPFTYAHAPEAKTNFLRHS